MTGMAGILFLTALLVSPLGSGGKTPSGNVPGSGADATVQPVAGDVAQEVTIRVRILHRAPAGNLIRIAGSTTGQPVKTVAFRFEIQGAPTGKSYQLWFQDIGMKADGLPPAPIPDAQYRFRIDEAGNWTPEIPGFEAIDFAKGEWMELRIKSTDGKVVKAARFTPFR